MDIIKTIKKYKHDEQEEYRLESFKRGLPWLETTYDDNRENHLGVQYEDESISIYVYRVKVLSESDWRRF